jgi:hypothetical protein
MKKFLILVVIIITATCCVKHADREEQDDRWNGYARYLKMGEQVHTLWAGKNLNVGTVTYGIDENANFYVTYDCSSTEWSILETHLFAGDKKALPLNRCSQPRVNRFPFHKYHHPKVETYTYRIPLSSLPPAEEPGFAVAAECVVYRSAKCDNREKVAWAEGDFKFTDKGCGWYDVFYFNQIENEYVILYGLSYANDSLRLYHLDITNNSVELTFTEYVGNTPGDYNAAAYDSETGVLFFARVNDGELWANRLDDADSSFYSGPLTGDVLSATYYNGEYYYVDALTNTIHGVTFNQDWNINADIVLDTIPGSVVVNDIAMDPTGLNLYMIGDIHNGQTELLSWNIANETFYSLPVAINAGAQIAFGSDGLLYAIAPLFDGGDENLVYVIDIESQTLTPIEDEIISIDDPFSDMASGPPM